VKPGTNLTYDTLLVTFNTSNPLPDWIWCIKPWSCQLSWKHHLGKAKKKRATAPGWRSVTLTLMPPHYLKTPTQPDNAVGVSHGVPDSHATWQAGCLLQDLKVPSLPGVVVAANMKMSASAWHRCCPGHQSAPEDTTHQVVRGRHGDVLRASVWVWSAAAAMAGVNCPHY